MRKVEVTYAGVDVTDASASYIKSHPGRRINFFDVPWNASSVGMGRLLVTTSQLKRIEQALKEEAVPGKSVLSLEVKEDGKRLIDESVLLADIHAVQANPVWGNSMEVEGAEEGLWELEIQDDRAFLAMRIPESDSEKPIFNLRIGSPGSDPEFLEQTLVKEGEEYRPYTVQEMLDFITRLSEMEDIDLSDMEPLATLEDVYLIALPSLICLDLILHNSGKEFCLRYDPREGSFGVADLTALPSEILDARGEHRLYGGQGRLYHRSILPKKFVIYQPTDLVEQREGLGYFKQKEVSSVDPLDTVSPLGDKTKLPIFRRISRNDIDTSNTVMGAVRKGPLYRAAYRSFLGDFLDVNEPLSLVSFSWLNGIPVTEIVKTSNLPFRSVLDGPFGHYLKDHPLRLTADGGTEIPGKPSAVLYATATILEVHEEWMLCRTLGSSQREVKVAKPRELRAVSPALISRIDVEFIDVFGGWNHRKIKEGSPFAGEEHHITPPYSPGHILQIRVVADTGVSVSGKKLVWEDSNEDARAWLAEKPEEEQ